MPKFYCLPTLILFCSFAQFAFSQSKLPTHNNCANLISVTQEVSRIRKLKAQTDIKCLSLSEQDFNQAYISHSNKYSSIQRLGHEEFIFKSLGVIPKNYNYQNCYLNSDSRSIKAFYSEELSAIISKNSISLEDDILAHEVVHALQEQNFNLTHIKKEASRFTDTAIGLASILEGDAVLVQKLYLRNHPRDRSREELSSKLFSTNQKESKDCELPSKLQELYDFPYLFGYLFAKHQGFKNLDQILRKFSIISTKEILENKLQKPNNYKYFTVKSNNQFLGLKEQFRDTLGQQFIRLLFSNYLNAVDSIRAAKGWVTDQFIVYSKTEKPSAFQWHSLWTSETDAIEYRNAWITFLSAQNKIKLQFVNNLEISTSTGRWSLQQENTSVFLSYWQ